MTDMPKSSPKDQAREDADYVRDMFTSKWGFGEPAPAYREAWQRDLETVQWMNGLAK